MMMNIIQVKVTYLIPSELGSFRLVSTYHVSYLAPRQIQSLYPTKVPGKEFAITYIYENTKMLIPYP